MKHIRTIIDKEWSEMFRNRMVILSMSLMPMLLAIMPLVMLRATAGQAGFEMEGAASGVPENFLAFCTGMNASECMQIFMVNQFLIMFMLMPLMIPITIAAYSIVGEKTTRSLEPLLATPLTTTELLTGKALAAVIPAVLVTYGSFGLFSLGLVVLRISPKVIAYILGPTWLTGILVLGPILSVIAVMFAVIVSSRVNDPRVAEQISAVMIIPLMSVLVMQLIGTVVINMNFMLTAIAVSALLAVGAIYLGASIFQRETILTRWK
ncbi:MAG: ABC transporter permease subunit [Anaerolineaceae bacterium]|jgi:ABC-2 type transport system permease protein